MKAAWTAFVVLVVLFSGVAMGYGLPRPRHPDGAVDILRAQLAEAVLAAEAVPESVVVSITKVRTLRDTLLLNITDTLVVKEYVTRVDTVLKRCEDCARKLDSLQRAARAVVAQPLPSCPGPKLTDRFGIWAGYGATKTDTIVRAGWQIGAGVRVFPWR